MKGVQMAPFRQVERTLIPGRNFNMRLRWRETPGSERIASVLYVTLFLWLKFVFAKQV